MSAKPQIFVFIFIVCFSYLLASPFDGLTDPACFVVKDESCPNKNVTFWLYTNETRDNPVELNPLDLNPSQFMPRKPVKILIHGYTGHRDYAPNDPLRSTFLDNKDVYVISVDYGPLVRDPCYFAAVRNLPVASKCLAQLINNLVEHNIVYNEDLHIIGFSLGGQVAGQTANYVKKQLKHITGLDPAKPMFITAKKSRRLDDKDAEFVDVIHTDILGRGMLHRMGHVDFYPNIGKYQPGCREENPDAPGSCNHERAPRFYAESIHSEVGFWGYACPSWLHYTFGLCDPNGEQVLMGYDIDRNVRGSYFLTTRQNSPFALGRLAFTEDSTERNHSLSNYSVEDVEDADFEPQLGMAFVLDAIKERSQKQLNEIDLN